MVVVDVATSKRPPKKSSRSSDFSTEILEWSTGTAEEELDETVNFTEEEDGDIPPDMNEEFLREEEG